MSLTQASRGSWALLLGLPVVLAGLVAYNTFGNVHGRYLGVLLAGALATALVALLATRSPGWARGWAGAADAAAWLVLGAFACYAGPAAAGIAVFLGLAAIALASLLDPDADAPVQLLLGLALLAAIVGWLLPLPIHDARAYWLLLALAIAWRRAHVRASLSRAVGGWRELRDAHPRWLLATVLAAGVAALGLWLPSLNYDDNAAHLLLGDQLLADRYYHLDVSSQVWALSPWSANVLHGIATVLGGGEQRAAVNALWLLLGMAGAYRLAAALGAGRAVALAAAAVYASHPLSAHFASSMQVDGISATVLLHLAAELARDRGELRAPARLGILVGLLLGLKASNLAYLLPVAAWLLWLALRRGALPALIKLGVVALLVGGSSYFYATLVTGNPLFPLFNAIFKSPYMPLENFHDTRWDSGMDWRSLWDLTFDTGRYGETYAGAAGIAVLALLPGVALELARRGAGRWIALWAIAAFVLMFAQIQYLRYVFPALAMLATVGLVGLSRGLGRRQFIAAALTVVILDALLMPTTSWIARADPWNLLLAQGPGAKAELERRIVPERPLLRRLAATTPGACFLLSDDPFVAGVGGRANAIAWYDPRLSAARDWANADASGERWQQVLAAVGASYVLRNRDGNASLLAGLRRGGLVLVDSEGKAEAWARPEPAQRRCDTRLRYQRDEARRLFRAGGDA